MKSSTYFFRMKTKTLADFQICISVPLKHFFMKIRIFDNRRLCQESCKQNSVNFLWIIISWRFMKFCEDFPLVFLDFLKIRHIDFIYTSLSWHARAFYLSLVTTSLFFIWDRSYEICRILAKMLRKYLVVFRFMSLTSFSLDTAMFTTFIIFIVKRKLWRQNKKG